MLSLAEQIEAYGDIAHLVTVNADGLPHVVSVRVTWDGDALVVPAGHTTTSNAEAHPDVTALWAAPAGTAYSLIVDGRAAPAAPGTLRVTPTRAVLHRTPEGDPSAPNCVTIVARE